MSHRPSIGGGYGESEVLWGRCLCMLLRGSQRLLLRGTGAASVPEGMLVGQRELNSVQVVVKRGPKSVGLRLTSQFPPVGDVEECVQEAVAWMKRIIAQAQSVSGGEAA